MNTPIKRDLKNYSYEALTQYLKENNQPSYRAQQIFAWLYKQGCDDIALMKNLPAQLRDKLAQDFYLSRLIVKEQQRSQDGTVKFLFELEDGNAIESVLIVHKDRNTVCISTQAGCKYGCVFCASGKLGFIRHLSTVEILNQILAIKQSSHQTISNIVFMGIGEPLDNYTNLLQAIRLIIAPHGLHIGQRKITISTAGHVEGIKKLSDENLQVELSVSLHAATNEKRSMLMPINKRYLLEQLIPALRDFCKKTKRKITFDYILLGGLNTTKGDVEALNSITRDVHSKVNLIPFNPVEDCPFEAPTKLEVLFFRDYLLKHNCEATVRTPRGIDIEAACGQLRLRYLKK